MAIYYALFENRIKELPKTIKTLDMKEALEELAEAEQETKKLFHAQTAEEAIGRAKAQMWAYKQIIDCYKTLFEGTEDSAGVPDIAKTVKDLTEEWKKVTQDSIAGKTFYTQTHERIKRIIEQAKQYVDHDKETSVYGALAASLYKALEMSTDMLAALKKEYDLIDKELENMNTTQEEEKEKMRSQLEDKTETEQKIIDELG